MAKAALGKASIEELKKEIRRRQRALPKLIAKRDELDRRIAELQALSAVKPSPKVPKRKAGRKGAGKTGTSKKRVTLPQALADVMKGKEKMSVGQAGDAVIASGYKTKSKDFRNVVGLTLSKDKRFKRVGRGEYALKG